MTMLFPGNLYPLLSMAEMMRSWLSLIAVSGSPTSWKYEPRVQLTSIVTVRAWILCKAAA